MKTYWSFFTGKMENCCDHQLGMFCFLTILAHSSRCNEIPQTGSLENNTDLFLTDLEAGTFKIKVLTDSVWWLVKAFFLVHS